MPPNAQNERPYEHVRNISARWLNQVLKFATIYGGFSVVDSKIVRVTRVG